MNIETIGQRETELSEQLAQGRQRFAELQQQIEQARALINAVEGALLDCGYWREQITNENEPKGEDDEGK